MAHQGKNIFDEEPEKGGEEEDRRPAKGKKKGEKPEKGEEVSSDVEYLSVASSRTEASQDPEKKARKKGARKKRAPPESDRSDGETAPPSSSNEEEERPAPRTYLKAEAKRGRGRPPTTGLYMGLAKAKQALVDAKRIHIFDEEPVKGGEEVSRRPVKGNKKGNEPGKGEEISSDVEILSVASSRTDVSRNPEKAKKKGAKKKRTRCNDSDRSDEESSPPSSSNEEEERPAPRTYPKAEVPLLPSIRRSSVFRPVGGGVADRQSNVLRCLRVSHVAPGISQWLAPNQWAPPTSNHVPLLQRLPPWARSALLLAGTESGELPITLHLTFARRQSARSFTPFAGAIPVRAALIQWYSTTAPGHHMPPDLVRH
ncbi:hypothetical protein K1T71_014318 [Dendrolimus kikuchii]|uniref:Uncharacterized protein n=1 Tax=Dendrolimus kikuchii TaxID=765133 RepID=A0ACC1CFK8_9NEOP|nr:hypothetical protein K1T71_014318 [Dendrolimus kikuchii]